MTEVASIVRRVLGDAAADEVLATVDLGHGWCQAPSVATAAVERADVAHALHVVLYADLMEVVPSAAAYAVDQRAAGRGVVLDHAAVRTVAWPAGALPPGIEQVTRILRPLGYERHATYPLTRLRMTGHAYAHLDRPEVVPQWFVSELHPDTFSPAFQDAVTRVLAPSTDPLDTATRDRLARLAADRSLPLDDAVALVDALRRSFGRQHPLPTDRDHDLLRAESAEMAWIATEGTTCNHCTDRVDDVAAVADRERERGRPIKDTVEVSASGRVRQTAHRATTVVRALRTLEGDVVEREVPGSFFEVISRDPLPEGGLDLAFDAANATGIFAMTRPADAGEPGEPA
ncbi:DUF1338 family protein [Iamia sp. SCSIO 61187]|uniref:2-oxoadipate dioxygenase/decarboxylase family protein n=1 Tax=Iamia sp. SCSIO 61187 TaxID=2722752 RepID=UPI001C62B0B9|nr:DUF1338 family protein [Iamia sp. SCSIO 61187]QYG94637.1 DUF1338 family protein [Iamia sp. SCSIO 61187]